jgi:hypothetical protein
VIVKHPEATGDPQAAAGEHALAAALARHGIVCEAARLRDIARAMPYVERMTQRLYEMRGMSGDVPEPMRTSSGN